MSNNTNLTEFNQYESFTEKKHPKEEKVCRIRRNKNNRKDNASVLI